MIVTTPARYQAESGPSPVIAADDGRAVEVSVRPGHERLPGLRAVIRREGMDHSDSAPRPSTR